MLAIALEKHCEIYKVTKKKPGSNNNENINREGKKCLIRFIYLSYLC